MLSIVIDWFIHDSTNSNEFIKHILFTYCLTENDCYLPKERERKRKKKIHFLERLMHKVKHTSLTLGLSSRFWGGFLGGSAVKNPPAMQKTHTEDGGFSPWGGTIPWRRKWHPLQNSCLGNPMDRGAWRVQSMGLQKSGAWLNELTTTIATRFEN